MDDQKKKLIQIIAIVALLIVAIGIFVMTNGGGGSKVKSPDEFALLCANPKCGHSEVISRDEYKEMLSDTPNPMMMMPGQQISFDCPECGKKTMFKASKCEKCENIFFPNYQSKDFYDRCPECGFSKIEESRK